MSDGPHLVLVGLMGTGKSTVGKAAAHALGRPFVDLDRAVEAGAGATIAELFARDGEPAFRTLEAATLAAVLADETPAVVATGGGTVLDAGSRQAMVQRGVTVWLQARPETLARRLEGTTDRPLLDGDVEATLARLAAARAPLYAEVAAGTVAVDEGTRRQVVDRVLAIAAAHGVVPR